MRENEKGNDWQAWVLVDESELEALTLARRSLLSKFTEHGITSRKEWVKGIPLKIQMSSVE